MSNSLHLLHHLYTYGLRGLRHKEGVLLHSCLSCLSGVLHPSSCSIISHSAHQVPALIVCTPAGVPKFVTATNARSSLNMIPMLHVYSLFEKFGSYDHCLSMSRHSNCTLSRPGLTPAERRLTQCILSGLGGSAPVRSRRAFPSC